MPDPKDFLSTQREQIRKTIAEVFESSDQASAMVEKQMEKLTNISRYCYRLPFQLYRGGAGRKVNTNGGTVGRGTGPKFDHFVAGYITTNFSYEIPQEVMDTMENSEQTIYAKPLNQIRAKALAEYQVVQDIWWHQNGTGILTNASSAIAVDAAGDTMTFASATDFLGVNLMRPGLAIDVWNGASKRAYTLLTGETTLMIKSVNLQTKTIQTNATITSLTAGDYVTVAGLDAYGPAQPTTGSSTWPTAPASQVAGGGLGGDSFIHGLYYSHDNSTSTYYLTKLKSTIPAIVCNKIDASVGGTPTALTFDHGWTGLDYLRKARGDDTVQGMVGLFPLGQRKQLGDIGISLIGKLLNKGDNDPGKMLDLYPRNMNYADSFDYCGMVCWPDKRQWENRADFLNPKRNWGRAELYETRPHTDPDGSTIFHNRNSSGEMLYSYWFGYETGMDYANFDPGAEFYIDGLAVAS